jgi:hypothetical protein
MEQMPGHTRRGILFEPRAWVGKQLPFLDELKWREKLARGRWLVVFTAQGCGLCQREVERARLRVGERADLAVVEVSGKAPPSQADTPDRLLWMAVPADFAWWISTPSSVELEDGVVVAVLGPG